MQRLAGRYRVGEVLGQGGSAVVHYGFDSTLKRPVAIKMFDVSATGVLLEARTAAGLNHPNIAQVYDYGEVVDGRDRTPYLVMEFVGGETLADRLARTGALRWRQAAGIGAETASALAAAHAQDLVHRDVNPRNIMLTPDGVKVLDFGIAAVAGQHRADTDGGLWGSPAHLAPEQLRGEPSFPAADVYALGLLLFECLTGSRAWPGTGLGEILGTRHGRPAPRLPRVSGLPREIVHLYEACTAEDPEARPSAAAVAETLRRVAGPAPLTGPTGPAPLTRPARSARSRPARPVAPTSAVAPGVSPAPAVASGVSPAPHAVSPTRPASPRRSRRRATVMGSLAVAAVLASIVGLQLANGTVTPGGREAEAAVEGVQPTTTPPRPSSPAPSSSPTTVRVQQTNETTTVSVRKKAKARTSPAGTPTTTPPTRRPTTPPAVPSSPPATSSPPAEPTPTPTPDETAPPVEPTVEPTDPETTAPPETDPPVTTDPETPGDGEPDA
ncbi:serine/threonine protein kinase [Actinoplanes sp. M2I2]|uniref:serine/threonine-protein kinase n=1 Tax=Actinoplanes sp. M2I2 TaxID=1734444 RepID=UPI0020221428|nr:serine/threonine protein kinase [Actinoplanes sp. M2I2]